MGYKVLGLLPPPAFSFADLSGKSLSYISLHWCVIVGDYYRPLQVTLV